MKIKIKVSLDFWKVAQIVYWWIRAGEIFIERDILVNGKEPESYEEWRNGKPIEVNQ